MRERERERAVCSTLFAFLVSCDCYVALSHEALGLSAVCDCGISWSYSLVFFCIYNIITIELYATFIKKPFFGYAEKLKYVKNLM